MKSPDVVTRRPNHHMHEQSRTTAANSVNQNGSRTLKLAGNAQIARVHAGTQIVSEPIEGSTMTSAM